MSTTDSPTQQPKDGLRTDLPREHWGPREWAALEQFMAKCWDGRMGQRVD